MQIYQYEASMGEYGMPEELLALLQGKTHEEQSAYFRTSPTRTVSKTNWGSQQVVGSLCPLWRDSDVLGLIVDGDIVVGVMMKNCIGGKTPCFLDACVCTYFASDNNGAGYTEREDYTYLTAVAEPAVK